MREKIEKEMAAAQGSVNVEKSDMQQKLEEALAAKLAAMAKAEETEKQVQEEKSKLQANITKVKAVESEKTELQK